MPQSKANQITLGLIMLGFLLGIGIYYGSKTYPDITATTPFRIACGISIVILVITALILQFSRECPNCEYIFTNKEINKQVTSSKTGYKTITRQERSNQTDEKKEWEEQVRVKTVQYMHTYKCSNCGHTWHGTSTKQYQDFDD